MLEYTGETIDNGQSRPAELTTETNIALLKQLTDTFLELGRLRNEFDRHEKYGHTLDRVLDAIAIITTFPRQA